MKDRTIFLRVAILAMIFLALVFLPIGVSAYGERTDLPGEIITENEKPSPHYDSILYSEIGPRLAEIAADSNRVRFEVFGQSAGGRDMYLVALSDPKAMGRLGPYQAIRRLMLTDPEKAQEMVDKLENFKVPVFINASIHGIEYSSDSGNAIVWLDYETTTTLAAGFPETDYAFVNSPVWFTLPDKGVETAAYFADDFLVSGYWPGWGTSGADGEPAIIFRSSSESDSDPEFTLFGIDLTFRGHPENTFRLIANVIFNGLD